MCWAGTSCQKDGSCTSHRSVTPCSCSCNADEVPRAGKCSPLCWSSSVLDEPSTPNLSSVNVVVSFSVKVNHKLQITTRWRLFYNGSEATFLSEQVNWKEEYDYISNISINKRVWPDILILWHTGPKVLQYVVSLLKLMVRNYLSLVVLKHMYRTSLKQRCHCSFYAKFVKCGQILEGSCDAELETGILFVIRTLVHKRRKIGPKFSPTQRTAIRLGTVTQFDFVFSALQSQKWTELHLSLTYASLTFSKFRGTTFHLVLVPFVSLRQTYGTSYLSFCNLKLLILLDVI